MPHLHEVLDVVGTGEDRFRSTFTSPRDRAMDGGQLAAQALRAVLATVPDHVQPHSIHATFIAAGDSMRPVDFEVSRDRDGRSFVTRHVTASQDGRLIFRMTASLQTPEIGVDVQLDTMPDVALPEASTPVEPGVFGFEARDPLPHRTGERATRAWLRPSPPLGPDARWNACALLYVTDMGSGLGDLVDAEPDSFQTSLDHAVWFHRPVLMDDWVLVSHHGRSLAAGRTWFLGGYFTPAGVHVASSAQELLYRPPRTPSERASRSTSTSRVR